MKLTSRLVGAVAGLAVAATMLSASPATAAPGDATLTFAPTAVLADKTCIDHAFTYAVELPAGTTTWTLNVEMDGPDGKEHGSQLIGTFAGNAPTGSDGLQLCSLFEPVGTYTIYSTVEYRVGSGGTNVVGPRTVEGTFQAVRSGKSKVKLTAKHKGSKITAKAKVGVSTGGEYGPVVAGSKVTFQKKVGKKWKKVDQASTDAAGVAKAKFNGKKGTILRAKFAGAGEVLVGSTLPTPPATSKAVRAR